MRLQINGELKEVPAGTSVAALLRLLAVEPGAVAVEVNREVVQQARKSERALSDGDRVEIVTFVGGG